jgi:DNA primase large subunit
MNVERTLFTEADSAKYPFLKKTTERVRKLDLTIEEIVSSENSEILDRAVARVENAILLLSVGKKISDNKEIPSFPGAIILAIATKNSWIKKRYALTEAKQACAMMGSLEKKEKIFSIALDFDWDIQINLNYSLIPSDFSISFPDYLRNAAHIHGEKWKLINRPLIAGKVYLNQQDVIRLLEEEIKRRIEKRLDVKDVPNLPAEITLISERLNKLAQDIMGQMTEEFPKVVVQEAFPPCINALYDAASKSHHLSHVGRFALVSFLVNIGMSAEAVTELFKTFSDYNERLTRYQVEHIAGERGSGTRYTPPQCSVLQTHGVCKNRDALCHSIHHPLKYYQIKVTNTTKKETKK